MYNKIYDCLQWSAILSNQLKSTMNAVKYWSSYHSCDGPGLGVYMNNIRYKIEMIALIVSMRYYMYKTYTRINQSSRTLKMGCAHVTCSTSVSGCCCSTIVCEFV